MKEKTLKRIEEAFVEAFREAGMPLSRRAFLMIQKSSRSGQRRTESVVGWGTCSNGQLDRFE